MSKKTELAAAYYAICTSTDSAKNVRDKLRKEIKLKDYDSALAEAIQDYIDLMYKARNIIKPFL